MARRGNKRKGRASNRVPALGLEGEEEGVVIARTVLRPTVQAAATLREYGKSYGDLELPGLIEALTTQTEAANDGDLGRGEAMLAAQAHTLDAIFNNLARRAINSEYLEKLSTYLKLALRAQAQCRATWEALAAIKNPPVMGYVRQANIAHGPQQVNNGSNGPTPAAEQTQNRPNKLLEEGNDERLDTGTTETTGGVDPALAPLGPVNGAEKR